MERQLKAELLRRLAEPDEHVAQENTYVLVVCDGRHHYRLTADEQRIFNGDCDCSFDDLMENLLVTDNKPKVKEMLANATGANYNRWEQIENFIQDANLVLLLQARSQLTLQETYEMLAEDLKGLARLDAGFSPRIGIVADQMKQDKKGGD